MRSKIETSQMLGCELKITYKCHAFHLMYNLSINVITQYFTKCCLCIKNATATIPVYH